MWRLTQHDRDDRGVVTLLVVGLITVFLLAAAAAIDITRFSQENSSAQHSADATAMAVATDCVRSLSNEPQLEAAYGIYRKIPEQVISDSTPINSASCSGNKVTITVEEDVNSGLLLDRDARLVHKTGVVQWGSMSSASTAPLTISACEYSTALLNGTTDVIFYMGDRTPHAVDGGPGCSGGDGQPPGGFGWLDQTDCEVETIVGGDDVPGSNGASSHGGEACVIALMGKEIVVPIFHGFAGSGSHAEYTIIGYATIKLTGYSFNGNDYDGLPKKCPEWKDRGDYCIKGDFVRFATQQGTLGPSPDMGTHQIYLSS